MKKFMIMATAALVFVGCGNKQQATTTDATEERVEVVELTTLHPREIQRDITLSSNLLGYQTQNVAPSVTGKIEKIYVEVGDKVKKGSDLVRMDQNQYKTTKISLANLKTELDRAEAFWLRGR